MRAVRLSLVVAVATLCCGCGLFGGSGADAITYNDRIVGIQGRVIRSMLDLSATFDVPNAAMQQAKLAAFQAAADGAVTEIATVPPFEGDATLRDAAANQFGFYKRISRAEIMQMVALTSKPQLTAAEVAQLQQLAASIETQEAVMDAGFAQTQRAFALRYGMPIIDNELQQQIDNM